MNYTKNNQLIAEFMGFNVDKGDGIPDRYHGDTKDGKHYQFPQHFYKYEGDEYRLQTTFYSKDMQYHTSWDWLMPVVAKLQETGLAGGISYDLKDALFTANIGEAYKQVVQIVQFYQTKQK